MFQDENVTLETIIIIMWMTEVSYLMHIISGYTPSVSNHNHMYSCKKNQF